MVLNTTRLESRTSAEWGATGSHVSESGGLEGNSSTEKSKLQKTANNSKSSKTNETRMVIARSNTNESRLATSGGSEMMKKNRDGYHRGIKSREAADKTLLLQRPTILSKPNTTGPPVVLNGYHNHSSSKDENSKPSMVATHHVNSQEAVTTPTRRILKQDAHHESHQHQLLLVKPVQPTILTPSKSQNVGLSSTSASKMLAKELNGVTTASSNNTNQTAVQQTQPQLSSAGLAQFIESIQSRLSITTPHMTRPVRLLDDSLAWQDGLLDHLSDQNTDYLVVGVLGKQGVGKSTLMSQLAGSTGLFDSSKDQAQHSVQHKTNGVSAFITGERTILLDVQPLLSGSILDKTIAVADSKSGKQQPHYHLDFKYYENYILMQSIELACFVLSVCNVVILAEDWFTDPNLFRVIQTAEMLMPNMNSIMSSGQQASGTPSTLDQDLIYEHHPHFVYMLNKSEYKSKLEVNKMKTCIENLMSGSKLIYKGSISSIESNSTSILLASSTKQKRRDIETDSVNFVLMPKSKDESSETSEGFRGLPSTEHTSRQLLRDILSVRRTGSSFATPANKTTQSFGSQCMTEKKWFTYANKVWDTIRKSPVMVEYNRLIT